MKRVFIDDYSALEGLGVKVNWPEKTTGFISKFEDDKFFIKDTIGIRIYSVEDFENRIIELEDEDEQNVLLLKIRSDKNRKSVTNHDKKKRGIEEDSKPDLNIVLEQWRLTIESAMNLSNRRQTINNSFIALITALISGVLVSNAWSGLHYYFRLAISVFVPIFGIIICCEWNEQMKYYGGLNRVKYAAARDMEEYLPFEVMNAEDVFFYSNYKKNKSFSERESTIPTIFIFAFSAIMMASVVYYTIVLFNNNAIANSIKGINTSAINTVLRTNDLLIKRMLVNIIRMR